MFTELLIFIITSLFAYYWYIYKQIHSFFEDRDVKFLPGIPVFGNMFKSTLLRRHMWEDIDEIYKAFPNEKYVGVIEGTTPVILIRDPELIKRVTVKDFEHFINHKDFLTEDMEPLFPGTLIMMKDEKWRDMRTTLSPAFTGSKMKLMMPFIVEICNNIIENLKERVDEDINVNDMMSRYTNDVIASTAFGIQVNSLKDRDNEFFKIGQNIFNFSISKIIFIAFSEQFPNVAKYLRFQLRPTKATKFFSDIVVTTMEYREKNNVVRPDMIHLLMEANKGTLSSTSSDKDDDGFATVQEDANDTKPNQYSRVWSQEELVCQVFTFFVAGFETSSSTITMCLHELAINPKIQDILYQEIREFKDMRGDPTYENIKDLKYLDCVLNETFRKWSVALFLDRVCAKEYILPAPREGGKSYRLKPGDIVYSMVNSIQMDEKYFPDPEVFDPDRFSEERKHNILPFTFMPFGAGPRACIGLRLALLELKVLLFNIILNFKVLKCKKTMDPIKLVPQVFNIRAQGGTWLKVEKRP